MVAFKSFINLSLNI
ncbi:hypothetical protein LSH36_887g02007 [Paralvinella palmiformis]|uniref:Uncharacterized protein n=1 Tax=Paralvinella palmiformis TaxID=53620 RepID=A0AAD9MSZ4_9ANNE|nr:hypothetical protein LSH36_887g02007 [Paralvinella palmiformis]